MLFDRQIYQNLNDKQFDYHGYITIVLTKYSDDQIEQIRDMFGDLWSKYISNVNVLAIGEYNATATLYTYYPFGPNYCEEANPIVQDKFINNAFVMDSMNDLYPEKYHNFYNCPIGLATYTFAPYIILQEMPNGSYRTDGIDGIIFRVIAQRLNFHPNVILAETNIMHKLTSKNITSRLRPSLQMVC